MYHAICSDRGIVKKINQDSALYKQASTGIGDLMLAAVCDGMGGLRNGEVASSEMIKAIATWFDHHGTLQLTHDQTVVQQLIDSGRITRKQAEIHPDRNILLQCIGAGGDVVPEYSTGEYQAGDIFLVCSDGFRHKLMEEEMRQSFGAGMDTEKKLKAAVKKAVEVNLQRKEKDNITVVAVRM